MCYQSVKLLVSLIFISFAVTICNSSEFVPVYMWKTQDVIPVSPALQVINQNSFKDLLIEELKSNPFLVIFAEETLSPEDFSQHDQNGKTLFKHLHKLLEISNVAYKPHIQNPIGAVQQLGKELQKLPVTSVLNNINVPKDKILIVDLNDAKDGEQRNTMLERHDSAISNILKNLLNNHDNILAIYTAYHTSWVNAEETKHRNARSLLQEQEQKQSEVKTDEVKGLITEDKNVLLYVSSDPSISEDGKPPKPITFKSEVEAKPDTITLTLSSDVHTFKLIMNFDKYGYWSLSEVTSGEQNYIINPEVSAPVGFSYHCRNVEFQQGNGSLILMLPGMQLQPFQTEETSPVFGSAYDCIGFTSIPIWSGIIVTIILLLILTLGITFMMDIKTMDRFDDAKGKTITINAE